MSYYAVKRGKIPGIYEDWKSCEEQIKGFSNAKFKKFNSLFAAEEFLNDTEDITQKRPKEGLAVDAAYSMKNDIGEYQIFSFNENKIVFRSKAYSQVTVNLMEFLAIVKGMQICNSCPIYSDSATAIDWVLKKQINTTIIMTEEIKSEINQAIVFLNDNSPTKLIKWDTSRLGDIPADFNRK